MVVGAACSVVFTGTRHHTSTFNIHEYGPCTHSHCPYHLPLLVFCSGKNLHKVLAPGFELEQKTMAALESGWAAPPLSIHTSAGTPAALGGFLHALSAHLPWPGVSTRAVEAGERTRPKRDLGPARWIDTVGRRRHQWFHNVHYSLLTAHYSLLTNH